MTSRTALETGAYEVGKFYAVLCVRTDKHSWLGTGWQPVIGPKHDDRGAVNFPHQHWHIDWRFVSKRHYRIRFSSVFSVIIMEKDRYERPVVIEGPQPKRMKCKREMPEYPIRMAQWIPMLQSEFKDCKMQNMVCPHRGLPLHGCETAGDVVTCPGHGLRWNVKTGELVT